MKKKRTVLSLNFDEIRLLVSALHNYTIMSPEEQNAAHSASALHARVILEERVNRLKEKLESKYE